VNVIVDTCIWSMALRRARIKSQNAVDELQNLILDHRVQMLGPIRQELLSGIKQESHFQNLKTHLAAFPDFPLLSEDYELAAEYFNRCRRNGVQGSNADFLICAAAVRGKFAIFTLDNDFLSFADYLPISLHSVI